MNLLLGSAADTTWGRIHFGDSVSSAGSLTGNATVVFGASTYNGIYNDSNVVGSAGLFTIGSSVIIHGDNGLIYSSYANGGLTNLGTINADTAGGTLSLGGGDYQVPFNNKGRISATNGGMIVVPASTTNSGAASLDESASGEMQFNNNLFVTTDIPARFAPSGTVVLAGGGSAATPELLEVVSNDLGASQSGFINNSVYGTLTLANNTYVKLVDQSRNSSGTSSEAVYVDTINVPTGTTLDLNNLHVYARIKNVSGTIKNGTIVNLVDQAPVLSSIETTKLQYSGSAPQNVTSTLTVGDPDSSVLVGATVQLTSGYLKGTDSLVFTNTANIQGLWDVDTGTMTLSGTDTTANYQAALQSVQFQSAALTSGTTTHRTIAFQVSDGLRVSNIANRNIDVLQTVLVLNLSSNTIGDDKPIGSTVGTFTTTDANYTSGFTYSLASGGDNNAFAVNASTGTLTTAANFDATVKPSYQITATSKDPAGQSITSTKTITIMPVINHAPVINPQTFSVTALSVQGTVVGTVVATDVDIATQGQTLTYSITTGNTNNGFAISANGQMTVMTPEALNSQTNPTFSLTVQVVDNGNPSKSASAIITIDVIPINHPPVVTPATFVVKGSSANGTVVGAVIATDPDANQTLTYSFAGGNANGTFAINGATGQITVANSAGLLNASTFSLIAQATDNGVPQRSAAATITVVVNAAHMVVTTGTGPNAISLVNGTSTLNFGSTVMGSAITKVITVSNNGNVPLTVQPVTVTGDFTIVGTNFTSGQQIAVEASSTFTIQYNADTAGTSIGLVTIGDSDPTASPSFTFSIAATIAASPQSIVVDVPGDAHQVGHTTLREAVAAANSDPAGDTISFASTVTGTISLAQGEIPITNSMNVTGPGANVLSISGTNASTNTASRIFDLNGAATNSVFITGLTLTGGNGVGALYSGDGGAIINYENLILTNDTFINNAFNGNDGGGAIANLGTLTSSDNTYSSNTASDSNFGGGAILNQGTVISTNDTFYGNASEQGGGAISNLSIGIVITVNDTITNNTGNDDDDGDLDFGGGGVLNWGAWNTKNTIIAGNASNFAGPEIINFGTINAYNTLVGDANSAGGIINGVNGNIVGVAATSIFGTSAGVPVLANNGGTTQTVALIAGSAAIGAGGALTTVTTATVPSASLNSSTTINVKDPTYLAAGDLLWIDSEIVRVSSVASSGNTITVLRGQQGTTPASHAVGATLSLAVDQRGSVRVVQDMGSFAASIVNQPPIGQSNTVTTLENIGYTFAASDFGFSDSHNNPPNVLKAVEITTLPTVGTLIDNGQNVTAHEFVSVSDINNGLLDFIPVQYGNGNNYSQFTFQVQDNGGTADGGLDTDLTPKTMTVNVTPVTQAPIGTSSSVSALENSSFTFAAANFGFTDPHNKPANTFTDVEITTVPTVGTFTDNGTAVTTGQFVTVADLNAHKLVFTPAPNVLMAAYASFTFQVQDNGSTANGGVNLDPTPKISTINVVDQLVYTQTAPTTGTAGVPITTPIVAQIEDGLGKLKSSDDSTVTLTISGKGGGTYTAAAVNGIVTFNSAGTLAITGSGVHAITVSDALDKTATSYITIAPTFPTTQIGFASNYVATAGTTIGPVQVYVEDQYGNLQPKYVPLSPATTVTLSITSGPTTSFTSGTLTANVVNGVATFSDLVLNQSGTYKFAATSSDPTLTAAVPNTVSINAATPTQLVLTSPTTVAGSATVAAGTALKLSAEDQFGNIVTTVSSVTLKTTTGTFSNGNTTATIATVGGIATFSNLLNVPGSYSFTASDAAFSTQTYTINVTPAAAAKLVFQQAPPTAGTAGAALGTVVTVAVEDAYNNVVTSNTSTVLLTIGTVAKTATAVNGVASFDLTNYTITKSGSYTISVSDGTLTKPAIVTLVISPASATQLAFQTVPTTGTAGTALTAVKVAVEDQYGNVATADQSTVITIAVATGPTGAGFTGTSTVTATDVNGVATFGNLVLDTTGKYTLSVTESNHVLTARVSGNVTIGAAAATHTVVLQSPTTAIAGVAFAPVVKIGVEDQFGNLVATANSVTLTLASGKFTTGLSTATAATSAGIATFNLAIYVAGTYTVNVTDSVTGVTGSSFSVTVNPAAANKLAYTQAPPTTGTAGVGMSPTVVVAVEDSLGNVLTTDSSTVTLTVGINTFTATAASGIATFTLTNLTFNSAATYTFTASDSSTSPVLLKPTSSLVISPAAASKVVVTSAPATGTAGTVLAKAVTAKVEDQFGNVVTTDTSTVTLSVKTGPGSFTSGSTLTATVVAGVATFSNLTLNTSGNYTFGVADGALTAGVSGNVVIAAAAATHTVIQQSPTTATAGVASVVKIGVEDQFGNLVATGGTVTLTLASGKFSSGLSSATANTIAGVATFNMTLNVAGPYTVNVTDSLSGVTGTSFNTTVNPAAASKLVYTTAPATTGTAGVGLPQIIVVVEDSLGNVVTSDTSSVKVSINTSPVTTLTLAAVAGVATFPASSFVINKSGTYSLTVSDGTLTVPAATSLVISPAAAAKAVFGTVPASGSHTTGITLTVDVEDAFGNIVSGDTSAVVLTINFSSTSGTFSTGTSVTVNAVNGVATFTALKFTKAGTYTLLASDGSLTTAISGSIILS